MNIFGKRFFTTCSKLLFSLAASLAIATLAFSCNSALGHKVNAQSDTCNVFLSDEKNNFLPGDRVDVSFVPKSEYDDYVLPTSTSELNKELSISGVDKSNYTFITRKKIKVTIRITFQSTDVSISLEAHSTKSHTFSISTTGCTATGYKSSYREGEQANNIIFTANPSHILPTKLTSITGLSTGEYTYTKKPDGTAILAFTMGTKDVSVTCVAETAPTYTLTVTYTNSECDCSSYQPTHNENDTVTLTFTAKRGYKITGIAISGDKTHSISGNSITFTFKAASITVTCTTAALTAYNISIASKNNCDITGINNPYYLNDEVKLKIIPDDGYVVNTTATIKFGGTALSPNQYTIDTTTGELTFSYIMSDNCTISYSATPISNSFTLHHDHSSYYGGSSEKTSYNYGENVTIKLQAESSYTFPSNLVYTGLSSAPGYSVSGNIATITFTMGKEPVEIYCNAHNNTQYSLTVSYSSSYYQVIGSYPAYFYAGDAISFKMDGLHGKTWGENNISLSGIDISDLNIGIDGTITFAAPSNDVTMTFTEPSYKKNLENCSWAEIQEIANNNNAESWFKVGDTKRVQLKHQDLDSDGVIDDNEVYQTVRIIDFKHDGTINNNKTDVYANNIKSGTETKITFEFADLISDKNGYSLAAYWNNNSNSNINYMSYEGRSIVDGVAQAEGSNYVPKSTTPQTIAWYEKGSSSPSNTYKSSVIDMLPDDLKNNLKEVDKTTHYTSQSWNSSTSDQHNLLKYNSKLFIPSMVELGFTSKGMGFSSEIYCDGKVYKYYELNESTTVKRQVKKSNGAITDPTSMSGSKLNYAGYDDGNGSLYWTRSPWWGTSKGDYNNALCVKTRNSFSLDYKVTNACAIPLAPAFCI